MRQHRYIRLAAALTALSAAVAGTAVIGAAPAGAADECMNVTFPATRLIDWDGYNTKVEYSPTVSIALAAGSYGVTGSSSDGYPSRVSVTQTSEIWELQFLDATGAVIATSGLTGDLPDRVADATWSGSLGTVTLPAAATAVRAHHRPDAIADGSANSVVPVAATVCPNGTPTTTTAPTTTDAPTTTAAPSTSAAPSSTAAPTTAPPTSATPTTAPIRATSIPTEVLAETTVVTTPPTTPTRALAVTGSDSKPLGGVALVLFGAGVIMLGWRAQQISRRG